jgi:ribose transport system ATP-binding protein
MSIPALEAKSLSKTFVRSRVLVDVDLTLEPGEVHALLGENGSGKSTLIKILSGYHLPDPGGEVRIGGERLQFGSAESAARLGCRFVHQDLGLVESESVLTNMSLGTGFPVSLGTIRLRSARRQVSQELASVGLELDPETPLRDLSPATKSGVAIARALRPGKGEAVRLLVLDEPTASLPDHEVGQLLEIVRSAASQGVAVLYVSHRLDEIFEIAATATVLRDGRKYAERTVEGLSRSELIDLLVGREFEEVRTAAARVQPVGSVPLLEVQEIGGGAVIDVSFDAMPGEILGLAGITGSGREALLPLIFGAIERYAGTITVDGQRVPPLRPDKAMRLGVAFLPADRKIRGGILPLTARENLTLSNLRPFWRPPFFSRRREAADALSWFDHLGVRPPGAIEQPLSTFSGGNQQKILIGRCLRLAPQVLLLDEPTQGVDVGAKADIYSYLLEAAERGTTVLVASSDPDELAALCHRVLVLRSGTIVAELENDDVSTQNIVQAHHVDLAATN